MYLNNFPFQELPSNGSWGFRKDSPISPPDGVGFGKEIGFKVYRAPVSEAPDRLLQSQVFFRGKRGKRALKLPGLKFCD